MAGAKKISMVLTYPPIKFPSYAGIDFPSQEELATFSNEQTMTDEELTEMVRKSIELTFWGIMMLKILLRPLEFQKIQCVFLVRLEIMIPWELPQTLKPV